MAERGTNRPTEAKVQMLKEMAARGFPSIQAHLGLVAAVCEDWLRLNAAETTIDAPVHTPGCWSYTANTLEPPHA